MLEPLFWIFAGMTGESEPVDETDAVIDEEVDYKVGADSLDETALEQTEESEEATVTWNVNFRRVGYSHLKYLPWNMKSNENIVHGKLGLN